MKTIIFIGTQKSGSSREAIKAAERLGYYTVLFTNREKHLRQREEYSDVHLMKLCDLDNLDELKNMIKELVNKGIDIEGIVSFVDSHCHTACLLAEEFGVNHFTTEAVYKMENKIISRNAMKDTKYIPQFKVLDSKKSYNENDLKPFLPGILKSPSSTGSKDVFKVQDYNQFKVHFDTLKDKYPDESIIMEEFLEGPQNLVEVVVIDREVHIVANIEQEISHINDHFIVTGYNLSVDQSEKSYDELKRAVGEIVNAHGMITGACHIELRYVNGIWKLIEINPRISGGGMNKLIEIGLGINLVEETLKIAIGKKVNLEAKHKQPSYIQYTTVSKTGTLERVTGKNRAKKSKGVAHVYVKPRKGNLVMPPKSMGHRYAYVLATGDNEIEAIENAKRAIKEIEFTIRGESE